ncbi:MAG: hypothetical protein GY873_25345 [Bosea sp.]|uniref:hypothetical protein n=1 Tax=Bosea sp. (in: a-proteobacteria) TaxID=1871050 RepID=UPI0023897BD7|nr:hypothetical protein [Bosea sp. (in: a-proteobacteria)]MCP4737523.1 hypothetical protein [Bosea sp. (in: a-proteobacteria)]
MFYAEILVAMGEDDAAYQRASYAGMLAGQLGASLLGVLSRWPHPSEVEPNATIGMVGELLAEARASCHVDLATVEARFRVTVEASVDRIFFAGGIGSMTEAVLREGRRADLIVIGQSTRSGDDDDRCDAQVLLTRGGRPVLIVPPAYEARALPWHVAIAWRDCRASRRVLREALPLLRRAQQVSVVTSNEALSATPASSAADVADFLQAHGVPARASGRSGAASLREFLHVLDDGDVDLLVAPAYCSNQLVCSELVRQTTHMLTRCRIPCLLAT